MGEVSVQFLGSGDAFGNRGRFQSCIHVWSGTTRFRIDCGASSLIAMQRLGPHLSLIDTVLLTHLTATTLGAPVSHYGSAVCFTMGKAAGRDRSAGLEDRINEARGYARLSPGFRA